METINENIRQLLEMLDNPDAYTEQEIQDIINHDEDTRETYRLMVEAKRSSRHRQNQKPVDVDAAWQRFNQKLQPKQQRYGWMKIAASFIGVLLVSGITFAAIHIVRTVSNPQPQPTQAEQTISAKPAPALPTDSIKTDTVSNIQPIVFDNITLDKMLPQIAAYYNKEVEFQNADARQFRFYFVWKQEETLEAVLHRLNLFESITVEQKDNKIIVE